MQAHDARGTYGRGAEDSAAKGDDIYIVLAAAGSGARLGGSGRKAARVLAGRAIASWSLSALLSAERIAGGAIVVHPEDVELAEREWLPLARGRGEWSVVRGGDIRSASVREGLRAAPRGAKFILVHDAARPLLAASDLARVIARARETGAAILAAPVAETLKAVRADRIEREVSREGLFGAQTPQVFRRELLEEAYRRADATGATDEAGLVAPLGMAVSVVESEHANPKLTFPADLALIEAVLRGRP